MAPLNGISTSLPADKLNGISDLATSNCAARPVPTASRWRKCLALSAGAFGGLGVGCVGMKLARALPLALTPAAIHTAPFLAFDAGFYLYTRIVPTVPTVPHRDHFLDVLAKGAIVGATLAGALTYVGLFPIAYASQIAIYGIFIGVTFSLDCWYSHSSQVKSDTRGGVQKADIADKPPLNSGAGLSLVEQAAACMEKSPKEWRPTLEKQITASKGFLGDSASRFLETFVRIPTSYAEPKALTYAEAKASLDEKVRFQEAAKEALITYMVSSQVTGVDRFVMRIEGLPGIGKTRLLNHVGETFGRPVVSIRMDNVPDARALTGTPTSYKGDNIGFLLEAIIRSGCLNPIILIDEVDKIKPDTDGAGIINLLNQLLDEENPYFRAEYLGLDIDLSRVSFVIAGNKSSTFDNHESLRDRLGLPIKMHSYAQGQLETIFSDDLIPAMQRSHSRSARTFDDNALEATIRAYRVHNPTNQGIRNLKKWADWIMRSAITHAPQSRTISVQDVEAAVNVFAPASDA